MKSNTKQKIPNNQIKQIKRQFEVCQVQSATCISKYGMYISQPWKYAGTHILLHCGMILHYFATFGYLHPALQIINIILHILSTISLIILAFTDPGMIPKIFPTYEKLQCRKIPTNYHRNSTLLKYYQKTFRVVVKGHNLHLKFCNTCYIYRPPRTVHCEDCGICIEKFDHHCPWIGTCVAKRNYKYFLFFLTVLTILTTKLFIETIVVTSEHTSWDLGPQIIGKSVINIFLCIYIFPAMGFALFMLVLHLKFAATNVTTNQFCKQTYETLEGNPFKKQSWIKNVLKLISFHYQGKVKFNQPIYDRNDKILLQNNSISSLNHQKDVNDTFENLNQINETKTNNNHQGYSTNVPDNQQVEDDKQNQQENYKPKSYQQKQFKQKKNQPSKLKSVQQQHPQQINSNSIAIYDISLKIHKPINQNLSQQKTSQIKNQGIESSQKQTSSLKSQKDQSQYERDEIERQQDHKLKVITEENQSQIQKQHSVDTQIKNRAFDTKISMKQNKNELSQMKMDQSVHEESNQKQKQILQNKPDNNNNNSLNNNNNTISLGNFRKRKKSSSSNEPKFL